MKLIVLMLLMSFAVTVAFAAEPAPPPSSSPSSAPAPSSVIDDAKAFAGKALKEAEAGFQNLIKTAKDELAKRGVNIGALADSVNPAKANEAIGKMNEIQKLRDRCLMKEDEAACQKLDEEGKKARESLLASCKAGNPIACEQARTLENQEKRSGLADQAGH